MAAPTRRSLVVPLMHMAPAGTWVRLDPVHALELRWPSDAKLEGKALAKSHDSTGWCIKVDSLLVKDGKPVIRSLQANNPELGAVVCDEDGSIYATTTRAYPDFLKAHAIVEEAD
jgi:hypothetical protein